MLANTLSLNSTVVQREGNVVSDMDGSKVMLSIEQGKYYNLGSIGGDIWDLMTSPILVKDIVKELLKYYEVEEEVCRDQVLTFVDQLTKEDLVVVSD